MSSIILEQYIRGLSQNKKLRQQLAHIELSEQNSRQGKIFAVSFQLAKM